MYTNNTKFGNTFQLLAESSIPSNDTKDSENMLGIQHSKSTGSLNIAPNASPAKLSLPSSTANGEFLYQECTSIIHGKSLVY